MRSRSPKPVQHITDKGREERHESPDREVEWHVELAELGARPTAKSEIRRRHHGHDGNGRKRGLERHTGQHEPPLLAIAQRAEQSKAERPDGSKHRVLASRPSSTHGQKRCSGRRAWSAAKPKPSNTPRA